MQSLLQKVSLYLCLHPMNNEDYGWIRLCSHCCRRYHFIFVYVQWTMKIKWYLLQQWLHKRIHPEWYPLQQWLHKRIHPVIDRFAYCLSWFYNEIEIEMYTNIVLLCYLLNAKKDRTMFVSTCVIKGKASFI